MPNQTGGKSLAKRIFKYLSVFLSVGLIATVVGIVLPHRAHNLSRCDSVERLARNQAMTDYLYEWADENLLDKGYYFVNSRPRLPNPSARQFYITGHRNGTEEHFAIPAPDSGKSDFPVRLLRLLVNKHEASHNDLITSDNVHHISYGVGRDSVILTYNGHRITEMRGHGVDSGKLKQVGDTVYAFCYRGHFRN